MKEQEIIDGNKLCAEFMNADILYLPPTGMYGNRSIIDKISRWSELIDKYNYSTNLKYHRDWNLLMPVVEKLNTLIYDSDKSIYILEQKDCFWDLKITSDINIVYKAVVEFIKWYNENK